MSHLKDSSFLPCFSLRYANGNKNNSENKDWFLNLYLTQTKNTLLFISKGEPFSSPFFLIIVIFSKANGWCCFLFFPVFCFPGPTFYQVYNSVGYTIQLVSVFFERKREKRKTTKITMH